MSDEIRFSYSSRVEFVDGHGDDSSVIRAMLVSTKADQLPVDADADRGRVGFLMKNRHGSPFEHNSMTFRVTAPIAVFREWHRHRIGWSYNEQSGRYTEFEPHFYVPPSDRPMVQFGKPGAYEFGPMEPNTYMLVRDSMMDSFGDSWYAYQDLLGMGAAKEVARAVLPVYVMSTMYATCNARSLMAFLSLRRKKNIEEETTFPSFPMFEIDDCAEQMERVFGERFPLTYEAFKSNGWVAP